MNQIILKAIALMNPEQETILSTTSPEPLQKLALSECDENIYVRQAATNRRVKEE